MNVIPVEALLDEAARVLDRAELQNRDLNDAENAQVKALLDVAERHTHSRNNTKDPQR